MIAKPFQRNKHTAWPQDEPESAGEPAALAAPALPAGDAAVSSAMY